MYKRVTVRQSFFILAGLALLLVLPLAAVAGDDARDRFVDVREHIPSVIMDIRYFSPHNFVGERIDGYNAPKCLLTREAAGALKRVQEDLEGFSLSLKIYDCYRPQRAVSHFVRRAKDIGDTRTRKEFYPTVDKSRLFEDGYIAERSGHSRGSTLDLTIVPCLSRAARVRPGTGTLRLLPPRFRTVP